jgi:tRNA-splicing ligase RtcB (3'-phosphate/5'-hydroxy nucleic acid ligase)
MNKLDIRPRMERVGAYVWEIPMGTVPGMRVPGRVYASERLFKAAIDDRAVEQVANVATLPGIVGYSYAMPDIHWGYGFPIGGVAATDPKEEGVISPGGVGFDIGCGVRLMRSDLSWTDEVKPRIKELVDQLGWDIPRGIGGKGLVRLDRSNLEQVAREGVHFPLSIGIGWEEDAAYCEDGGKLPNGRPDCLSEHAIQRGARQLGSLGAGNHFLEVQVVDEVRDEIAASVMGLFEGQVCVMIHTGSRGLGHQTCTDHLRGIDRLMPQLGIHVPDRQLACVPLRHELAERYFGAMDAAGNFARANRHVLADAARKSFGKVLGRSARDMRMSLVYDVSHNLAKFETYEVAGRSRDVCVHRKGATRAFGPGHPHLPEAYRSIGQPVFVPGSMGTPSFVLVGTAEAGGLSFSSTCHGAGRTMSRAQAKKRMSGPELKKALEEQGVLVARSRWRLLSEEAPYAYKDPTEVVESCEGAGLSKIVARLRPVGVIKG